MTVFNWFNAVEVPAKSISSTCRASTSFMCVALVDNSCFQVSKSSILSWLLATEVQAWFRNHLVKPEFLQETVNRGVPQFRRLMQAINRRPSFHASSWFGKKSLCLFEMSINKHWTFMQLLNWVEYIVSAAQMSNLQATCTASGEY